MVYAICSGGGKQPGNDSKDSSAVQPASLSGPSKPTKFQPTIPPSAHGSSSPPGICAVQPAHRSSMIAEIKQIDALSLEGACPKSKDAQSKRIDWINQPSQQTQKTRSALTQEFKRSLELVKNRMASSNVSPAQKTERHWDNSGNMSVVNRITAGEDQQQPQQIHHQESDANGAAMEHGSTDMEHSAGQTAGDSDCYKLAPSTTSGERLATCHCSRS